MLGAALGVAGLAAPVSADRVIPVAPRPAATAPPVAAAPSPDGTAPPAVAPSDGSGARGARAKRVLIISEDGLRGDVLAQLHLPWHEALYQHGAYSWKARTIRTASTLPAHAAMLSGFDVKAHGLDWNNWKPTRGYIRVPTIFEEAESHGMRTAMFVGKFKLRHIARPGTVEVFERPGYYCKKVADEAADYLVRVQPAMAFVHFSNPDEAGHSKGWESEQYLHAISEDDRCLGVIVAALEKAGLADETLIIISADHGGHSRVHSGALAVDREIPWIAHGPGVRDGYRIRGSISTLDTAATALDALGLPIPEAVAGRPVTEIYRD
jgi:predicted AlkP superfamily pyrophosphatase or phosphodiesterase